MTTKEEVQIASLIRVASRLVAIMEQEVASLRSMRVRDIAPLQEEKAALAATYEADIRNLARDPELLADVSPALQEELGAAAVRLHQTLAENERAIRAARTAQDRVLQAIVAVVEKNRSRHQGYGVGTAAHPRACDALSLTLDRTL
jgi:flagellar biosynthesis/type III secretory pathway chaperone